MSTAQRRKLWAEWVLPEQSCLSAEKMVRCILNPSSADTELQLRALTAAVHDMQSTPRSSAEQMDEVMRIFLTQAAFDEELTREVLMAVSDKRKSDLAAASGIAHASSFPISVQCTAHALADTVCDALSAARVSVVTVLGLAAVEAFLLYAYDTSLAANRISVAQELFAAKVQARGAGISTLDRVDYAVLSVIEASTHTGRPGEQRFDQDFVERECGQLWIRKFQTDQAAWRAHVQMPRLEARIVALLEDHVD
jgi:hypothetical protein